MSGAMRLRVTNPGDYKFVSLLAVTRTLSTKVHQNGGKIDIMLLGTTTGEVVKVCFGNCHNEFRN